jgi:large subunit ribosomal protein L4
VLDPQSINVYEILKYPQMVLDQGAVAVLQERLK